MRSIRKPPLLFHTVRHLTLRQIAYRASSIVRKRWRLIRKQEAPKVHSYQVRDFRSLYQGISDACKEEYIEEAFDTALERAVGISECRFFFFKREIHYEHGVNWHDPTVSQLWRYHLHYFDYVDHLLVWSAVGHAEEAYRTFRKLVESWIQGNHRLRGDGWHPYTVSLRIVNWVNAYSWWRLGFEGESGFGKRLLASLYGQARFLAGNLEYDVRGNHLIKNLKALIWAGVAFKGKEAQGWCVKALNVLKRELAEQILNDGSHFERTPGYHATVLKDCLEICIWLKRNNCRIPYWLDESLARMLDFLKSVLPFDGKLPLLKDTAWDVVPPAEELLSSGALYLNRPEFRAGDRVGLYPMMLFGREGLEKFSEWEPDGLFKDSTTAFESGFFVLRDQEKRDYLIFDGGKTCPEYLPAHAHADMFSFELMLGGQRVVVDSGVYEYERGEWRDFFRSTRAHNTVELEDMNQSEVWGSFRVARRAHPGPVNLYNSKTHVIIDAWHDGYKRLGLQAVHRRVLIWRKGEFWLVFDEILGKGQLRARSYVHLHPSLKTMPKGVTGFFVKNQNTSLNIQGFLDQDTDSETGAVSPRIQGWYSERFGVKQPNIVLCFSKRESLPFCLGYLISRHADSSIRYTQWRSRSYTVMVEIADKAHEIVIRPEEVSCS